MSVYLRIYSETSDTYASYTNADYPTARAGTQSTAGGVAITAAASVRNYFSGSTYIVAQSFFVFNTSALTAPPSGGAFSISVSTFGGNPDADTLRIRQVSSISNKIAGAALSGHTPIFANPGTFPTTTGRYSLPVINASLIPATTAFQVCLHTVGNENGTVPTGVTGFSVNFADQTGTTSDPYLDLVGGWSFVGVSSPVVVATTGHTLTLPAGTADGDLLIATFSTRIASTTSMTLASGWTLVGEAKNNNTLTTSSALPTAVMAYIVRGASAPALTFTHPVAPSQSIGRIIAYRGSATTTPLDAFTAVTTGTGTTAVSVAGLTTTQDDDLIVAMAAGGQEAAWSGFTNVTTPLTASGATDTATALSTTAWIERADSLDTSGADGSLAIFDAIRTTTGATGNLTVTASVSAGHAVIAGAFKIAASAAVPVTVNVTGQAVTAAVGEVTVSTPAVVGVAVDLVGQEVTASVGTSFTVIGRTGISTIATGQEVTAAVGEVTATGKSNVSTIATGQATTAGVGQVGVTATANVSTTATGQEVTASVGQVSVSTVVRIDASTTATGQAVTAAVGEVSVTGKANVSTLLAGQAVTSAAGQLTVAAQIGVSVPVVSEPITSAVGIPSITTHARFTVTGQEVTSAVSFVTVGVGIGASVLAAGQQVTSAVGTPTITTQQKFTVTGQEVIASGRGVSVSAGGSVSVTLSSGLATAAVGQVGVNTTHKFSVTGTESTAAVGQVSVDARQTVSNTVVGQSLAVALGTVTVTAGGSVSVLPVGQSVAAQVGAVNVASGIGVTVSLVGQEIAAGVGEIAFLGSLEGPMPGMLAEVGTVTVTTGDLRGMDVWTGTSWVGKPTRVWTGGAWVAKPVKVWNGSIWA